MTDYPNWFSYVYPNFRDFLFDLAGKENLRFLQLGVFTGDASVWMLDNILTGADCQLHDVDTWEGSDEPAHDVMDFDDVYKTYKNKVEKYFDIVMSFRQTTTKYLTNPKVTQFDFIYIDADHTTVGVILDAELAWPRLKSGGIMAFDDYTWQHESGDPRLAPTVGIDLFLHRHQLDYQLLVKNSQVWIKKK